MKRILIALAAVLVAFSASAQVGIVGGITSAATHIKNVDVRNANRYHVGLAYKIPFSGGFAIQPELLYNLKGGRFESLGGLTDFDVKTGYLEAGAQFQWGVDIDEVHPYLFAEPFAGYALNSAIAGEKVKDWTGINRFEYGLALGFGAELIRHVQISVKYFWNMGRSYNEDGSVQSGAIKTFMNNVKDGNVNGISLSAAILF